MTIFVTIGHYGMYDDYETQIEYVGFDENKAFDVISHLDYHEDGMAFLYAHVEAWQDDIHIATYDENRNISWSNK